MMVTIILHSHWLNVSVLCISSPAFSIYSFGYMDVLLSLCRIIEFVRYLFFKNVNIKFIFN